MNKYKYLSRKLKKQDIVKKGCLDKKAFDTFEAAKTYQNDNQDVYFCKFCKKYHRTTQIIKLLLTLRVVKKRKTKGK